MEDRMTDITVGKSNTTTSKVFHWARSYDLLLRIMWGRSEQRYRQRLVQLAGLNPGEAVLDVGSGTGTLAIEAKRIVGKTGIACGIDASPEMIARARRKAKKAG